MDCIINGLLLFFLIKVGTYRSCFARAAGDARAGLKTRQALQTLPRARLNFMPIGAVVTIIRSAAQGSDLYWFTGTLVLLD